MSEMEPDLIIEILKFVVPIAIALVSLAYAIKQRGVVKSELSKKRYFESALSNLNEAIGILKSIDIPDILTLWKDTSIYRDWEDACVGAYFMTDDILRANFKFKAKKMSMKASYHIIFFGGQDSDSRRFSNPDEFKPQWLIDSLRTNRRFSIGCEARIIDFEWEMPNTPHFGGFEDAIKLLNRALEALSSYEEVYEAVSPDSVKKVNQLFEEIVEEIFKIIRKPRRIEIDLENFAEAKELTSYLFGEILDYSSIAGKFSKVSELIEELVEARKELFLKIS